MTDERQSICPECSAVVADLDQHRRWHLSIVRPPTDQRGNPWPDKP